VLVLMYCAVSCQFRAVLGYFFTGSGRRYVTRAEPMAMARHNTTVWSAGNANWNDRSKPKMRTYRVYLRN